LQGPLLGAILSPLTTALVIVPASSPALVGSSLPAALESFCGERLLDRALAIAARVVSTATRLVVAASPITPSGAQCVQTVATDLRGILSELAHRASPGDLGLALDPRYPMLTAATLRTLIAAASEGQGVAIPGSNEELAALAMPLGAVAQADRLSLLAVPDRELARVECKKTLVQLEARAYLDRAHELLADGLMIRDPATTRIQGPITFGTDVEIEPDCTLRGPLTLGDRVRIGRSSIVSQAIIANDTEVRPFSIIENASIGERSFVGPYARIRPGTSVGPRAQIGNFVELKAARLGAANRINHLSFVGDATFGDQVTIGAGTITCNHDGTGSQPTTIGAGAYVGSACVLVAPVTIGEGATIGAGSTITRDAPPAKLTLARTRQFVVEGWRGGESKRK
jgi:bifunctional N-acetylglucosamine-1-phosphate-uridyltransferase/glucosamine-1-phosphate-acetyltransferase GlmU-like protein